MTEMTEILEKAEALIAAVEASPLSSDEEAESRLFEATENLRDVVARLRKAGA